VTNPGDSGQLVSVTPTAAEKVRELLSREADPRHSALRLAVRDGCCSGYQYALGFDHARDDDHAIASEGLTIVVDPQSAPLVRGSTIDFVLDLRHSGFKIENPNASSTCRCGESFELAGEQTGE
jgi:iron-sulfur cluster assembly accessory protein